MHTSDTFVSFLGNNMYILLAALSTNFSSRAFYKAKGQIVVEREPCQQKSQQNTQPYRMRTMGSYNFLDKPILLDAKEQVGASSGPCSSEMCCNQLFDWAVSGLLCILFWNDFMKHPPCRPTETIVQRDRPGKGWCPSCTSKSTLEAWTFELNLTTTSQLT